MRIEVWSDVVCPWCYIGKRRLGAALSTFEDADDVEVVWRSFELDPDAPAWDPAAEPVDVAAHLGAKYGGGREEGLAMIGQVSSVAAGEGLEYHLERAVRGSTRAAHRVLHAAGAESGAAAQEAVLERLMHGYFCEGAAVADPAVLGRLAGEAGFDAGRATAVARSGEYEQQVADDVALARALGISGVPFFVLDRRYGVSGAQPVGVLSGALEQAWQEPPERAR